MAHQLVKRKVTRILCDNAIKYYEHHGRRKNGVMDLSERVRRLKGIKYLAGLSEDGTLWITDSDAYLMAKCLKDEDDIRNINEKLLKTPEKRYRMNVNKVIKDLDLVSYVDMLMEKVKDKELTESECGTLSSVFGIPKHYFEVIKNGVD